MNSRTLREIPLRILKRKVGDERVTLLQACYDNTILNNDDSKGYPTQHRKSQEYGPDIFEDGIDGHGPAFSATKHTAPCHVANDYMHSLPPSRSMPNEITFRAHRKRSRLIVLLLVCLALVVILTIGVIVYFIGHDSSSSSSLVSSSSPSSPVITLANVQGSLTVIAGPFAVYNQVMADSSSLAFNYIRNAFVFEMDKIFMSSDYASLYNRTLMSPISDNKSHVLLSFVIYIQPNTTASPSVMNHIRYILVTGLRNSIFGIDESSTVLKPTVISPSMIPTPTPGQCQPILLSKCVNLTEYSSTTFPNLLGHTSPQEAEMAVRHKYEHLFMKPCYGYAVDYYCSVFVPECGTDGKAIPPCRKYCHDIMTSCNGSYEDMPTLPFTCDDLPDSEDPNLCRKNPYQPGSCVPVTLDMCLEKGINHSAFPSALGGIHLDMPSIMFTQAIQSATNCFKHSVLFSCTLYAPPCSGLPYPHHLIPPCSSLCFAYRRRCEIFHDIFNQHWAAPLNCSDFPDSPDPSVCIGYYEAREPEVYECGKGEIKCGNDRCIKTTWLCDGFQDCDDNSDEAHCATCGSDEQMCSPASSLCIHKSQGCNGANDCYMNVDEHFCVRMDLEFDRNVLEVYNSISSEWEEVCEEGWTATFSDIACRQLGYKEALATYYEVESNAKKSKISFLKNGSDPDKLQSYMDKGHLSCSTGNVVKLVCWKTVCGIRPAFFKSATRVVGGDEVKPGAWPWMASLHGGSAAAFFCGGTIIHPQWILTAGHCVGGGDREISYWTVKTGSTRRIAYSEYRQVRKVRALYSHPDFSMSTVDNDIALIHLEKPLAMNDFVRPVCLPDHQPNIGTRCYATGWGKTSEIDLGYEPALRQVPVDVTSWDACKLAVGKNEKEVPYKLTQNMFCAGGAHAHDACQGDSGGPLVCRKDNTTDYWYQGGIVSWGVICGQPNTPGVYTKLSLYVKWINEIITNYSYPVDGSNTED